MHCWDVSFELNPAISLEVSSFMAEERQFGTNKNDIILSAFIAFKGSFFIATDHYCN